MSDPTNIRDSQLQIILKAHTYMDTDPHLAVYMVRDLPIVKDARLDDLAWALCGEGGCHRNDAHGFFGLLDKWIIEELEEKHDPA